MDQRPRLPVTAIVIGNTEPPDEADTQGGIVHQFLDPRWDYTITSTVEGEPGLVEPGRARSSPVSSLRLPVDQVWESKWLEFQDNLDRLRSSYEIHSEGTTSFNRLLQARVESTFGSCWDLKDWLGRDPRSGISDPDLHPVVTDDPLRIACAIANTAKHLTRNRDKDLVARVAELQVGDRVRVWIEYGTTGQPPARAEALELAEKCTETWKAFITSRGLVIPILS